MKGWSVEGSLEVLRTSDTLERVWRHPRWLAFSAGATGSAMLGGASLGGLALLGGMAPSPIAIAIVAGFFLSTHLAGVGLSRRDSYSSVAMISSSLSVGHTILLLIYGLAALQPAAARAVLSPLIGEGAFTLFTASDGSFLMTFGPLYFAAMVGFSVLAPVSLIIFRYIAFRK